MSDGPPPARPPRTDLPYLRRRRRPGPDPTATAVPAGRVGAARRPTPPAAPAAPAFVPRRTSAQVTTALTLRRPTVMLNRLQSGLGTLTIEARWAPADEPRLGCAYRLASGHSAVARPGPPGPADPLLLGVRDGLASITVDLLRGRFLDRLVVFAVQDRPPSPRWTGALWIRTYGGAVLEVALAQPPAPGVLVLASLYNVSGELVVRAEREHVAGSVRDAALAYGFDTISWVDDRS